MAETGTLKGGGAPAATPARAGAGTGRAVLAIRVGAVVLVLAAWEAMAQSGLVVRDIIPPVSNILLAAVGLLGSPEFYVNLWATGFEVGAAIAIGTVAGIVVGLVLGGSRFIADMFEPYIYYVSPTPRIVLFPIMLMLFGVGPASKIALGGLSSFFPVALATAAGMRGIDKVLVRVGKSFRANAWQMATKIYLPAMRVPVLSGVKLGLGSAIITVLLAETKLSKEGLGFLLMQIYARFDMASLYALLALVFAIAAVLSVIMTWVVGQKE